MNDDLSIRIDGNKGLAPPVDLFAVRPDRKGPKTIAILLILGSLTMIVAAYGDISLANTEDLSQAELDALLTNVREANKQNVTDEQYQEFHDEARESGAYSIRGWSVMIGGIAVGIGGFFLFKLNSVGVKYAISGATFAAIGGIYANYLIYNISLDMLPEALILANKISGYLCGICMVICIATSALPVVNASARAALDQKVELINEDKTLKEFVNKVVETDENNLAQDDEEENDETEETTGSVYNIQNITIQDSVVVDSVFTNSEQE